MSDDGLPGEAIEAAVKQLSSWWLIEDKRDTFEAAVRDTIKSAWAENPGRYIRLYVDYDPQGPLLDAVRAAGVECRGFMFSASGIFRCQKSGVTIRDGKVFAKRGYGDGDHEIWPNKEPS